jgi:acetyl/propionyl-CoA carboxylase alpha subunit
MQRRIDLLNESYRVTAFGQHKEQQVQVADGTPQAAVLTIGKDNHGTIQLGNHKADIQMAVKGEKAYIRAFGRTFTLDIMNPVEQAAQDAGSGSDTALAPMPGRVVKVHVAAGEKVLKGQPVITIESMKILTVITAPRNGKVSQVHFEQGKTFDRNAPLITLKAKEKE